MSLSASDRTSLLPILDDLSTTLEDLLATGLTTATKSTLDRLDATFKEASRLKFGRLAASLRFLNEETGRYVAQSPDFDARRLSLFLNRSWVLAVGTSRAIRANDEALLGRLLWTPAAPQPRASVRVVTVGVLKSAKRTTVSFDFRLREVDTGEPLVWSFLSGRPEGELPELRLHMPQPQQSPKSHQFHPKVLLGPEVITITQVAVGADGRMQLGPKATVRTGDPYEDFSQFARWDPARALERLRAHAPSPLDLEVELYEEVVLEDWTIGGLVDRGRPNQRAFPIHAHGLTFDAVVSTTDEGTELTKALTALRKGKTRPPLFGLLHYESCRLILRPLSLFDKGQMRQLMLSGASFSTKELMAAINLKP